MIVCGTSWTFKVNGLFRAGQGKRAVNPGLSQMFRDSCRVCNENINLKTLWALSLL